MVFGSRRCDGGPQLQQAMRQISDAGGRAGLHAQKGVAWPGAQNQGPTSCKSRHDTVESEQKLGSTGPARSTVWARKILRTLA